MDPDYGQAPDDGSVDYVNMRDDEGYAPQSGALEAAYQSGLDDQGSVSPQAALAASADARKEREAAQAEYTKVLSEQQKRANAARDQLIAARDRLASQQPDRSQMWLNIAAAFGRPTRSASFSESANNAVQALADWKEQQRQMGVARNAQVEKYNEAIAGYGNGADAIDENVLNQRLALARLRMQMAGRKDVAAIRGSGKAPAQSEFSRALQEAGIMPGTPEYQRQMRAHIAKEQRVAPTPGSGYTLTPDDIKALQGVRDYSYDLPTALGRSGTNEKRQAMLGWLHEQDPDWQETGVANIRKLTAQYNSQKLNDPGGLVTSFGTAIAHGQMVKQLAVALNAGDMRTANKLKNMLSDEFGGKKVVDLKTAVELYAPEIEKAIMPGGGGEREREAKIALLDGSRNPQAIISQIDGVITPMMGDKMNSLLTGFYGGIPQSPALQHRYAGFVERHVPKHVRDLIRAAGLQGNWVLPDETGNLAPIPSAAPGGAAAPAPIPNAVPGAAPGLSPGASAWLNKQTGG